MHGMEISLYYEDPTAFSASLCVGFFFFFQYEQDSRMEAFHSLDTDLRKALLSLNAAHIPNYHFNILPHCVFSVDILN